LEGGTQYKIDGEVGLKLGILDHVHANVIFNFSGFIFSKIDGLSVLSRVVAQFSTVHTRKQ